MKIYQKILLLLLAFSFSLNLFAGDRPDIHNFNETQQMTLARLLAQFACTEPFSNTNITTPVVFHAESLEDAHSVAGGSNNIDCNGTPVNEGFLPWHRTFIEACEAWLISEGYSNYVPLPAWDPCTPIPEAFLQDFARCDNYGPLVPGDNLCATFGTDPYDCEKLCSFDDFCTFSIELEGRHNFVHNQLGGPMGNPALAAGTSIFYIWHAWVDDVFKDWEIAHLENDDELPAIEVVLNTCLQVVTKVKTFDCLESVEWSVSGEGSNQEISISDTEFENGYYFVSFCPIQGVSSYSITANFQTACAEKKGVLEIEVEDCEVQVTELDCGIFELLMNFNGEDLIGINWDIESPAYEIKYDFNSDFFLLRIGANQSGFYTIDFNVYTDCGFSTVSTEIYIDVSEVYLPPFTPIEVCKQGSYNAVCFDMAFYQGLIDFEVLAISSNLGYYKNGTELCLYANTGNTEMGSITILPIGVCGEGAPVTWSIRINDPHNCDGGPSGPWGPRKGNSDKADISLSKHQQNTAKKPELSFRISPNPNIGSEFYIDLEGTEWIGQSIEINIANISGQRIYQEEKVLDYSQRIRLNGAPVLAPGIYLLIINSSEGQQVEKMIVQ